MARASRVRPSPSAASRQGGKVPRIPARPVYRESLRPGTAALRHQKLCGYFSSSFLQRHERPRFRSDVFRRGSDQAVIAALLDDVGRPTGGAGNHKDWREHLRRDSAEMKSGGAVKIEIRKQLFLAPHDGFDALRNRIEPCVT